MTATKLTDHHIIPRGRGGDDTNANVTPVPANEHATYHRLFGNRTPDEIIEQLVTTFWAGQWHWLDVSRERFLDGPRRRGKEAA